MVITAAYNENLFVGRTIRMAIARLLRHDRIEEGFRVIHTNVQVVNNVPNATEKISKKQFLEYVRTWKEFVLFVFQCITKFIERIT